MNYIEWVHKVFSTVIHEDQKDYPDSRYYYGLQLDSVAETLGFQQGTFDERSVIMAISNALVDLHQLGLLELGLKGSNLKESIHARTAYHKPTYAGKQINAKNMLPLIEQIASLTLDENASMLLNKLLSASQQEQEGESYVSLIHVDFEDFCNSLGTVWNTYEGTNRVSLILNELNEEGFVAYWDGHRMRPAYKGFVWVEQNLSGWHKSWVIAENARSITGGHGKVTKVIRRNSDQTGALKELRQDLLTNTERRVRLEQEVRILEKLDISSVPKVLEHNMQMSKNPGTPLYLVTEWVDGQTLDQFINNRPTFVDDALSIIKDIATILHQCHSLGVYHRDIKPSNIMIEGGSGKAVLLDFGIAWLAHESSEDSDSITENADDLRNRWFSIPDLAPGRKRNDPRTDITQLLAVLVYMLTGKVPRVMLDEQGRPPHVALASYIPRATLQDSRWDSIRTLLDKGFQSNIVERIQTVDELVVRVDGLLSESNGAK